MVERLGERNVSTAWGDFRAVAYRDCASGAAHIALVHGQIKPDQETLVRVHEPTSVLDTLFAGPSSHSWSVDSAAKAIKQSQAGVLVLMNCQSEQERLFQEFSQWTDSPSEESAPRQERYDLRTYGIGAQILRDLNVGQARLLAKPRKMPSMTGFSLTITGYDSEPSPTKQDALS